VPFGLTANEIDAWIHHGGGQQLWDELSGEFGIKPLVAGNTGVQLGGWFRNEVNSLEDFQGLKFRMPGLGGEVLRRVGAAVVNLPAGEIFAALQSGTIDATEWVGPWNDLALGLYRVAKFYYYPGFHEPGAALSVGIARSVWDSLSDQHKANFGDAAAAENNVLLAEYNARNTESLETLINEHGVQLRRMPTDLLNAIGEQSGQVIAEVGAEGGISKRVYDSFIAFRRNAIAWTRISEQAFADARLLPFTYVP
jgi:TRAP-type mannitol/chloroaromatic compound transport system substrate-binding protein